MLSSAETGGVMKDIRTLTVEKIRAYHHQYYRPDNMCVFITGKVRHSAFCQGIVHRLMSHSFWETSVCFFHNFIFFFLIPLEAIVE